MNKRIMGGVLAAAVLSVGLIGVAPSASASPVNSNRSIADITAESALPYFAGAIKASKKVSSSAKKAEKACDRLVGAVNPSEREKFATRAKVALEAAYAQGMIRSDLFIAGEDRTNTRQEKKMRGKAYSAVALSAGDHAVAISTCKAVGVNAPKV